MLLRCIYCAFSILSLPNLSISNIEIDVATALCFGGPWILIWGYSTIHTFLDPLPHVSLLYVTNSLNNKNWKKIKYRICYRNHHFFFFAVDDSPGIRNVLILGVTSLPFSFSLSISLLCIGNSFTRKQIQKCHFKGHSFNRKKTLFALAICVSLICRIFH